MQPFNLHLLKTTLTKLVNGGTSRCYYYTKSTTKRKPSLYSEISPLGNPNTTVSPVLDQWVQTHNKEASFGELQRIIRDLRKRKRFSQALEVSEWTQKKDIYKFTPTEHAVHLDLIGKVHGYDSAEIYFNNLTEEEKTEKSYGALLHSYVRQNQIEKSLSHFQKMKEKGITLTSTAYNDLMCLYTHTEQPEKVAPLLIEMKKNRISPDNLTYRLCINSLGIYSDIKGMERVLSEMENEPSIVIDWNTYAVVANFYIKLGLNDKAKDALKKAETRLEKKDGHGFNHLISLYATLGDKTEVIRIWELEKSVCKRCLNRDYINMLQSLVRLGEVEEAEKLLVEWELSDNCYDFRVANVVILGYIAKGLPEKAEAIREDLIRRGKSVKPSNSGWRKGGSTDTPSETM